MYIGPTASFGPEGSAQTYNRREKSKMKKLIALLVALSMLFAGAPQFGELAPVSEAVAESSSLPEGMSARSVRKISRATQKPRAGLSSVCRSVTPLARALLKNAWPGHISKNDPRASGFAFVCGADCPRKFPMNMYNAAGVKLASLGMYGLWEGNGRPRAYCGAGGAPRCSVSTVVRGARANGGDGKVYLDFGNGSCRSATPGARNGRPG